MTALDFDMTALGCEGVLNFAAPAIEVGDPVAVAVPRAKHALLDELLREAGAEPQIFDMAELGRNPARIIPAVQLMLARNPGRMVHVHASLDG